MRINPDILSRLDMVNALMPKEHLMVGGQPSQEDLTLLVNRGIKSIVNLRPSSENIGYDEAACIAHLGADYHLIPVSEIHTFTRNSVIELQRILQKNEPTLVHCASGNRVGALIALMAYWLEGISANDAMTLGVQSGLTKLQSQVAQVLAERG